MRLCLRNFDARHGLPVERKVQCSQEDGCSFHREMSQHEDEVCRGRELSEAKVTIGPFFDNRADL